MPIQLKNMNRAPQTDYDTVSVLGLDIPKTRDLPFGGQVELIDLQGKYERAEMGQFEYLMRLFCLFTWRLPKTEHVRYEWLAQQSLEPTEMAGLMSATAELLNAFNEAKEGAEGKAASPKRASKKPAN